MSHARVVIGAIAVNVVLGLLVWLLLQDPSRTLVVSAGGVLLLSVVYLVVARRIPMRNRVAPECMA